MEGILLFILYSLLFFYLIKFAFRLLKPWLIAYFLKKVGDKFKQEFKPRYTQNTTYTNNTKNENAHVINNKSSKKATKKVGEYIDFEEID